MTLSVMHLRISPVTSNIFPNIITITAIVIKHANIEDEIMTRLQTENKKRIRFKKSKMQSKF